MTNFRDEEFFSISCENLQNHIMQCLNCSDDSLHYEEMMFLFRHLHPEVCGQILSSTLEQWKSDPESDKYSLLME